MIDLRRDGLLVAIFLGAIGGIMAGAFVGEPMTRIGWLATLFLNALKMTIVPLVFAAIVSSICALGDVRRLGRLGLTTILYYTATTAIAVAIGLVAVNLVQPGIGAALPTDAAVSELPEATTLADVVLNLVPENVVRAAADLSLIQIIFFALVFGAALTTVGERGGPLVAFFDGLNLTMMRIVEWVMVFAPVGIFALIADRIGQAGGGRAVLDELAAVGSYVLTVLGALFVHGLVLFAILRLAGGRGLGYLTSMLRAVVTAFGTASSAATLPLTIECAIEAGVRRRSVQFVAPLGATVNMDGTALYEAVAVLFIAQVYGVELTAMQQVVVFVTATLAAVGAAGIPQAGLVTMLIVLSAVGLPAEGIGLLLAVDWLLDRFRTAVNVWGDSVGCAVIDRWVATHAGASESHAPSGAARGDLGRS